MFGTEIHLITFIFICFEIIVLFFQFPFYLSRAQDKSRFRFLILIIAFIFYNICSGFLPDKRIQINLFIQNIVAFGSGIILATYYFFYLVKELNISQKKLFNTKILLLSLVLSFVFGFVITYLVTGNLTSSKRIFIIFPILISIYFCITTIKFLTQKKKKMRFNETPFKAMIYSGYLGIIFMASMPVVVYFGDYQTINNGLVNISFILSFYAYIKYITFQGKIEHEFLQKSGYTSLYEYCNDKLQPKDNNKKSLRNCNLTSRELDIAYLILKELTFEEIASETFISPKTVSKHASNIYKKLNCCNKREFIDKFSL